VGVVIMLRLMRARPKQRRPADHGLGHLDARAVGFALLVGAAYYAGNKVGFALTPEPNPISTLWPPNAILFAGLMLAPRRTWWLILLAVLPAHLVIQLQSGVPIPTSLVWFITNTGEALLGAYCVQRFAKGESPFKSFRGVSIFIGFGVIFAPLLTSFLDAAGVVLTGRAGNYWLLWRERLSSNVLSNLTLVPAIVLFGASGVAWVRRTSPWRIGEAVLLAAGILLMASLAFGGQTSWHSSDPVFIYAPLPFLLWAAVRFGPGGGSAALLVVALLAVWNAIHGRGPFTGDTPAQNVLFLQVFLIVIQIPLIYLAALIEERKQTALLLRRSEERYRNVLETQTELICRYLPDGTLTFVNDAYCRSFGKKRDELVGRKFIEFIPEQSRGAALKHLESLVVRPRVEAREHEVMRPDGSTCWQRWMYYAILDSEGRVIELQGIGRDFSDLKQAEESLQHLTARLLHMQDEERRRIARELHDSTAQNLFALTVKLAMFEQQCRSWTPELEETLSECLALGEQTLQGVRALSYLLHPPLLDQAGLVSALRWYVEGFTKRCGINVDLLALQEIGRLPSEVETALFRVVQEGLTNIQRHSHSASASVRLEKSQNQIVLQIKDEGSRTLLKEATTQDDLPSVGVGGMRQRIAHIGGRLEITSDGQGTILTTVVPLAREENYT
jgi:PAS domain S-box-containing protein